MGRGQGPPAYLAPLPHDAPKTKVHWESPRFLFLDLEVPTPTRHRTYFLCRAVLYIYYPTPPKTCPLSLRWMFAEWVNLVYIWQRWLVVHVFEADSAQRSFVFMIFLCLPCFLFLVVLCFLLPPICFPKKTYPTGEGFLLFSLFIFFMHHNVYTSMISPCSPSLQFLSSAQPLCPALPVLQQI